MALIAKPYKQEYYPDETVDNVIGFNTYNYYLECILKYIEDSYGHPDQFCSEVLASTKKLKLISDFDKHWVEKWLKLSWNTEFLLNQNTEDAEIVRFNNHWSPILCYFSIYSCLEAFVYLLDENKANGHNKALKKGINYFVKSGMSPWDFAFKGARGKNGKEHKPFNFPRDIIFPNCLERVGVEPIQMIGTCLKAEHYKRIDKLYKKSSGKYKYEFDPDFTGIFHFLYRLRLRSNYEGLDLFVSDASDEDIKKFSDSLCHISFWSLMYMELFIIRKCGLKFFLKVANDYIKLNSNAGDIHYRCDLYKKHITIY